jgi:3-isopropylmalate/(R)-2-methylmalate dehydratase small subunit
MTPFTRLTAIAAALPIANVDTDMLVPAAFLKTVSRSGLGGALLRTLRFDRYDREIPDFILNCEPWRASQILVALDNFGCGSSREHAPWALLDFGIRCVIAPSFAEIFHTNCFKNGILPITLKRADIDLLMADASRAESSRLGVDLTTLMILRSNGESMVFDVNAAGRDRLLNGIDDIAITMEHRAGIEAYEAAARRAMPWRPRVSQAELDSLNSSPA